jgi:hypothetical protein
MVYYATGVLFSTHNSQGKNINERAHADNADFVNNRIFACMEAPLNAVSEMAIKQLIGAFQAKGEPIVRKT